jgi:hypothetical protein
MKHETLHICPTEQEITNKPLGASAQSTSDSTSETADDTGDEDEIPAHQDMEKLPCSQAALWTSIGTPLGRRCR